VSEAQDRREVPYWEGERGLGGNNKQESGREKKNRPTNRFDARSNHSVRDGGVPKKMFFYIDSAPLLQRGKASNVFSKESERPGMKLLVRRWARGNRKERREFLKRVLKDDELEHQG